MVANRYGLKGVAAIALVVTFAVGFGVQGKTLCEGFLPENDMQIHVGMQTSGGITQEEFNAVLDRVEAVYGPIVRSKGGSLVVNRLWDNPTVNASANQFGGQWHINMYGGLARHPEVTADGFAIVACHELGHHIGGHPKMGWATNEGGSDYFATLKCLRNVYPSGFREDQVQETARAACAASFPDEGQRALCGRSAMAGLSTSRLLASLRAGTPMPTFETPDSSVVPRTNNRHPAAQCRLDTYYQGAICTASLGEDVSNSDHRAGACTPEGGYSVGTRPLCWFKPPTPVAPKSIAATRFGGIDAEGIGQRVEALRAALQRS